MGQKSMEQKSNVSYRAEKIYKHSREKFGFLIREVVSNAIHSTIIRAQDENNFNPQVKIDIKVLDDEIKIEIRDNGNGFNAHNSSYFTHLDEQNPEKVKLNFHPMGQGRLAIVFFTDGAYYNSVFKTKNGELREKEFNYPEQLSLFDIENLEGIQTNKNDTETELTLYLTKQQTLKRAKTFFSKYSDSEKIRNWFIDNFFPFFMEVKNLELYINMNEDLKILDSSYIENSIESKMFSVDFEKEEENLIEFKLWLLKKDTPSRVKNQIKFYARHLQAEVDTGKIEYEIDLDSAYDFLLTSDYFDNNVDQKGDKIEIEKENIEKIQFKLSEILDEHFSFEIKSNKEKSKKNFKKAKDKYKSLSIFMDENKLNCTNKILNEVDILSTAIDYKGKAEKNYWSSADTESEDIEKLINSSLHIYINHRKRILDKLKDLIRKFDSEGELKRELEDEVHDIFFKRGESLNHCNNINHLHNLWILDDKYTIFTDVRKGKSTSKGQEATDIYLWADDPERTKELLILELKSTTHSHNTGNKYESMVAQVKRYASNFYNNPEKIINWDVKTDEVLYSGIILARKSDIYKELNSNNSAATACKIPYLKYSYFFNTESSIASNKEAVPKFEKIKIDMYAYEDILYLAQDRNNVFFKLLQGELNIDIEE